MGKYQQQAGVRYQLSAVLGQLPEIPDISVSVASTGGPAPVKTDFQLVESLRPKMSARLPRCSVP